MKYQGKQIVAVEIWAEGYYSGTFAGDVGFMFVEDFNKYVENVNETRAWFHDLDGKHSEIEATVDVHYEDIDIVKAVSRQTSDYRFYESTLENIEKEEATRLASISEEIAKQFTVTVSTVVDFNGEKFVL